MTHPSLAIFCHFGLIEKNHVFGVTVDAHFVIITGVMVRSNEGRWFLYSNDTKQRNSVAGLTVVLPFWHV